MNKTTDDYGMWNNTSTIEKYKKEIMNSLISLLKLSLLRSNSVFQELDFGMRALKKSLNKIGLTLKSNFSIPNKNPMFPFCRWQKTTIGKFMGSNIKICDIFKESFSDKGICYTMKLNNSLNPMVGKENGFKFLIDNNRLRDSYSDFGNINKFGPGGTWPIRPNEELLNIEVYISDGDSAPTLLGLHSLPVKGITFNTFNFYLFVCFFKG